MRLKMVVLGQPYPAKHNLDKGRSIDGKDGILSLLPQKLCLATLLKHSIFYSTDGKFCSVVLQSYVPIRCLPYFIHIISLHCLLS